MILVISGNSSLRHCLSTDLGSMSNLCSRMFNQCHNFLISVAKSDRTAYLYSYQWGLECVLQLHQINIGLPDYCQRRYQQNYLPIVLGSHVYGTQVYGDIDKLNLHLWKTYFNIEYHANAIYENPYKNSEKIACIGQRLMYPIMEKKILPHHARFFLKCHLVFRYLH